MYLPYKHNSSTTSWVLRCSTLQTHMFPLTILKCLYVCKLPLVLLSFGGLPLDLLLTDPILGSSFGVWYAQQSYSPLCTTDLIASLLSFPEPPNYRLVLKPFHSLHFLSLQEVSSATAEAPPCLTQDEDHSQPTCLLLEPIF